MPTVGAPSVTMPRHEVGAARGEHAGEHAAAALADDRDPLPVRSASASSRSSIRSQASCEQPTLARMPARRVQ